MKCNNIKSAIDTLNCVVKDLNMTLISSGKLMSEQRKESTGSLTSVQTVPTLDMIHRNFQEMKIKMKLPMLTVRFLILMIDHLEIIFQLFNRKWGPYDEVCNNHKLEKIYSRFWFLNTRGVNFRFDWSTGNKWIVTSINLILSAIKHLIL